MRLFFFLALAFFVISLICAGIPTSIAGLGWNFWAVAALLCWLLDGAPTFTIGGPRQPQP